MPSRRITHRITCIALISAIIAAAIATAAHFYIKHLARISGQEFGTTVIRDFQDPAAEKAELERIRKTIENTEAKLEALRAETAPPLSSNPTP